MTEDQSITTPVQLAAIIAAGESDRVEFSESLSGIASERIREAICAFANDLPRSGEPGVVLVGVRDDGSLAGLEITDPMLIRLADMKTDGNILPPPSLTVRSKRCRVARSLSSRSSRRTRRRCVAGASSTYGLGLGAVWRRPKTNAS